MVAMRPKAVFTGFDSAWTCKKQGAIAHVVIEDGESVLVEPEVANFAEALASINAAGAGADLHVIAVDQPLIVPNETASRPVEAAFRSMLGSLGGAIQPSSRSRVDMFGDTAPIWKFMADLDADEDAFAIHGASAGRFA